MKKTLKLTEKELTRMVNEIINESYPNKERKRKETNFSSSQFEPFPREENIMSLLFGDYEKDVPPNVIQYIRKNLDRNLQRLGFVKQGSIKEGLPSQERKRKETNFRSSQFEPYPKEEEIMNKLFGPYKNDVPVNVIQYLRKNLRRNVSRLGYVYKTEMNEVGGYDDNYTGTKHTIGNVETLDRAMSAITDGLVNLSKAVSELMVDEQERTQLEKISVRMTEDAIQMNEIISKLYDKYKSRFKGNQIGMSGGGQFSLNEKK